MADVTIVSEDAERLVREGGVVNRDDRPLYFLPRQHGKVSGAAYRFTAEVAETYTDDRLGEPLPAQRTVGTVTVVDVHHADECQPTLHDFRNAPVEVIDAPVCPGELGMWHWTVEVTQ